MFDHKILPGRKSFLGGVFFQKYNSKTETPRANLMIYKEVPAHCGLFGCFRGP